MNRTYHTRIILEIKFYEKNHVWEGLALFQLKGDGTVKNLKISKLHKLMEAREIKY